MKILGLLQFSCFRGSWDVKVLRHKDNRNDLWGLVHAGEAGKQLLIILWIGV